MVFVMSIKIKNILPIMGKERQNVSILYVTQNMNMVLINIMISGDKIHSWNEFQKVKHFESDEMIGHE